jgi:hypothetical protein
MTIAISLPLPAIPQRKRPLNHSPQTSTLVAKLVLLLFLASLASLYLIHGSFPQSLAQSTEEREFENAVPKHLPIKVKLKKEKEKAIKDLKNEKWVRDFQLEVTNTGNKPIYFLSLVIDLPGITAPDGDGIAFSLHYGRSQLASLETRAEPNDVPINPGETYVFSFPDNKQQNWERFRQRENKPDAKKLILYFQILSFGDGTGFMRSDGISVPRPPNESSSLGGCEPEPNLNDSSGVRGQHASRRRWPAIFQSDDLPASFLLAIFLPSESLAPVSLKSKPPISPRSLPRLKGRERNGFLALAAYDTQSKGRQRRRPDQSARHDLLGAATVAGHESQRRVGTVRATQAGGTRSAINRG